MDFLQNLSTSSPLYSADLPVSKKKVSFTPFKVKDAKNIAIILQENNKKLALDALIRILKNNVQGIDVSNLCLAEAEYLFLLIRSKSVDEFITVLYENNRYEININEIKCLNSISSKLIKLDENVKLELKLPTVVELLELESLEKENLYKLLIEKVIVKNEIYEVKKFLPKELSDLIDNLPLKMINEFDKFLSEQPRLSVSVKLVDGSEKEIGGNLDFFIFR
jgi:hypothetical protein